MNINLEALNEIPKMMELVSQMKSVIESGTVEKRWFNTRELADYTGFKFETIKSKIKKGEFTLNVHYFKKGGILLFDKIEVDNWVMGRKSANNTHYENTQVDDIVDDILSDLIA